MKKISLFLLSTLFLCLGVYSQDADNEIDSSPIEESISIKEVSRLALVNNFDIQIARYEAYISRQNSDKAKAVFDTFLSLNASYYDDQTEKASTLLGAKNLQSEYTASLQKKMPTGTTITLEGSQIREWTDSGFSSVNPSREARASVSLTQSVGENFFGLQDRLDIKQTILDVESAEWLSLDSIEKALAQTQKAYWGLVLANRVLEIKKDILDKAKTLLGVYQDRYSRGLTESPDLYATQANVEVRLTDVATAELEKERAKNDLLFLLNEDSKDKKIIPQDVLTVPITKVDLNRQLSEAIDKRRDYKIAKNNLEYNRLDVIMKKNSLWPQIDLTASFTHNGLTSDYKESWADVTAENNPELFLGVEVKLPLENTESRAEYKKAKLTKEKYLVSLKKVERNILREIRNKVAQVNTWADKAETFRKVAVLQDKKLRAEQKRFDYGRSSSDLLIRYQEDLLQSRLSLAQALFEYRLSLIDLGTAKNSLLGEYLKEEL